MLAAMIMHSNRIIAGTHPNRSDLLLREALNELGFETRESRVVPDSLVMTRAAIREAVASRSWAMLITGGTGIGPRDVTAEATLDLLTCELSEVIEAIRRRGTGKNPHTLLPRSLAGVVECAGARAIIISTPGSGDGASDIIEVADPLLWHLVERLDDADR